MGTRIRHRTVYLSPEFIDERCHEPQPWQESPEEAARSAQWALARRWLLDWVRARMAQCLTRRERHCVELYYFEGLTFAEAGLRTGTHASSVCRATQRAVGKLRRAAAQDRSWEAHYPRRGNDPPPGLPPTPAAASRESRPAGRTRESPCARRCSA